MLCLQSADDDTNFNLKNDDEKKRSLTELFCDAAAAASSRERNHFEAICGGMKNVFRYALRKQQKRKLQQNHNWAYQNCLGMREIIARCLKGLRSIAFLVFGLLLSLLPPLLLL